MRSLRTTPLAILALLTLAISGCSAESEVRMPDVVGSQLDAAKSDVKRAGFADEIEVTGGGLFGILNDANWEVCEQHPPAGRTVTAPPKLVVERWCESIDAANSDPTEPPAPQPSTAPTPTTTEVPADDAFDAPGVTATTVSELVERLNSANYDGIMLGDRFKLTGALTAREQWTSGADGAFSVYLKTDIGSDLLVQVDEELTSEWTNGMNIEMVVEMVETTINGETTDGWLRAIATRLP